MAFIRWERQLWRQKESQTSCSDDSELSFVQGSWGWQCLFAAQG
jgi:hypothetical protein